MQSDEPRPTSDHFAIRVDDLDEAVADLRADDVKVYTSDHIAGRRPPGVPARPVRQLHRAEPARLVTRRRRARLVRGAGSWREGGPGGDPPRASPTAGAADSCEPGRARGAGPDERARARAVRHGRCWSRLHELPGRELAMAVDWPRADLGDSGPGRRRGPSSRISGRRLARAALVLRRRRLRRHGSRPVEWAGAPGRQPRDRRRRARPLGPTAPTHRAERGDRVPRGDAALRRQHRCSRRCTDARSTWTSRAASEPLERVADGERVESASPSARVRQSSAFGAALPRRRRRADSCRDPPIVRAGRPHVAGTTRRWSHRTLDRSSTRTAHARLRPATPVDAVPARARRAAGSGSRQREHRGAGSRSLLDGPAGAAAPAQLKQAERRCRSS